MAVNEQEAKKVFYIVAGVIAIMVLFPPYVIKSRSGREVKYSGYSALFAMPKRRVSTGYSKSATINVGVLSTQIVAVLVVGSLAYLAAKEEA